MLVLLTRPPRNVTVLFKFSPNQELSRKPPRHRRNPKRVELLRYYILAREMSLYFLKLAIDQITSAAPAQKDAGGTVEE